MLAYPHRSLQQPPLAPSVLDENMLNVPKRRSPIAKQMPASPRVQQQRISSYQRARIRQAASSPALRSPSYARQRLRPRGSRLDLLDNKNLTSFPSLSFTGDSSINIIEDYFPARPVELDKPLDPTDSSWSVVLQKKLRWRWRLAGLVH